MKAKFFYYLKIINTNLLLLLSLLCLPAVSLHTFRFLTSVAPDRIKRHRDSAYYPTFKNKEILHRMYNDMKNAKDFYYTYRSFVGWRKTSIITDYVNVGGPYLARKSLGQEIQKSTWFFGGSTMWGNGVIDSETIPSHFNLISSRRVYNFGEGGWGSRQSLNQLLNVLGDGYTPKHVIFYDGVNDVQHQCRVEITKLPSHSYQTKLESSLRHNTSLANKLFLSIYQFISEPYQIFLANKPSSKSRAYDCSINPSKSRLIANHLVNNWYSAYVISRQFDFKFNAILQPTIYSSSHDFSFFSDSDAQVTNTLKSEYEYVYPLIVEAATKKCRIDPLFCASFVDGSKWLESSQQPIFFDFNHLNSDGNKLISQKIFALSM